MESPERPNFEGHENRECGEHRTVGAHRAWCHDDGEWCYPSIPCRGCELPHLRVERDALAGKVLELAGLALYDSLRAMPYVTDDRSAAHYRRGYNDAVAAVRRVLGRA